MTYMQPVVVRIVLLLLRGADGENVLDLDHIFLIKGEYRADRASEIWMTSFRLCFLRCDFSDVRRSVLLLIKLNGMGLSAAMVDVTRVVECKDVYVSVVLCGGQIII